MPLLGKTMLQCIFLSALLEKFWSTFIIPTFLSTFGIIYLESHDIVVSENAIHGLSQNEIT